MKTTLPKNSVINSRNFKKVTKLLNHYEWGNCWGMTLFLLGKKKHLSPIHGIEMEQFLKSNTHKVKKLQVGDILVLRYPNKRTAKIIEENSYEDSLDANLLSHTALYIGKDKFLHQVGYQGPIREHSLKQLMKIYYKSTKIEYARVTDKKKPLAKKRK